MYIYIIINGLGVEWIVAKPLPEPLQTYCQLNLLNKPQCNLKQNTEFFFHENTCKYVCNMSPIFTGLSVWNNAQNFLYRKSRCFCAQDSCEQNSACSALLFLPYQRCVYNTVYSVPQRHSCEIGPDVPASLESLINWPVLRPRELTCGGKEEGFKRRDSLSLWLTTFVHHHQMVNSFRPGVCITMAKWHCCKTFSQWEHSFHLKAVLPLAESLGAASNCCCNTGPFWCIIMR